MAMVGVQTFVRTSLVTSGVIVTLATSLLTPPTVKVL